MASSTGLSDSDRKQILDSLTSEDLKILQEAFTVYDKNHDGTINTKVEITLYTDLLMMSTDAKMLNSLSFRK